MYGGVRPPSQQMIDFSGIPGMQGMTGMLAGMMLYPVLMGFADKLGYAGLQFGGQQNFYDRFVAQDYFMQSRAAIARATEGDQERYYQKFLGIARLTGTEETDQVRRAARTMASDMAKMGMFLADIMPQTFDEIHGVRGSEAMMARKVFSAGRYMTDPLTNQIGLRGETAGILTSQIYNNLFGVNANIREMQGLGAGRVGELFDEIQRRGFLGGAFASRDKALEAAGFRDSRLEAGRLGSAPGGPTTADDNLRGAFRRAFGRDPDETRDQDWRNRAMETQEVKEQLSKSEADRISKRLKNMVGAVSAMRDIFGDMGKPDAPMVELINGLQTLTQGGMAQMDSSRLEMLVRRTQALTKLAGISMEGMLQLISRGAGLTDQYGLDRQFVVPASQEATAFATAFGNVGGGGNVGWRMPTKDELTALDQSLRLTGARSDTANQLNATMRIFDEMRSSIRRGSRFEKYAEAIKAGQVSYEHGGRRYSVATSFEDWRAMAQEAGVDPNVAFAIRAADYANQEYGVKYNTGNIARRLQRDTDIVPLLRLSGEVAFNDLAGGDRTVLGKLTERAVAALFGKDAEGNEYRVNDRGELIDRLRNPDEYARGRAIGMTKEERADSVKRVDALVRILRASPEGRWLNEGQLRQAASRMMVDFEDRIGKFEPLRAYRGANGVFEAFDPDTLQLSQQYMQRAQDQAQLQSSVAGLGRTGILRRFMDRLETMDSTTKISDIVLDLLGGGVPKPELQRALEQFGTKYQQYQKLDPNDRRPETQRARETLLRELSELVNRARSKAVDEADAADLSPEMLKAEAYQVFGVNRQIVGAASDEAMSERLSSVANRRRLANMVRDFRTFRTAAQGQGFDMTSTGATADEQARRIAQSARVSFDEIRPVLELYRRGTPIQDLLEELNPADRERAGYTRETRAGESLARFQALQRQIQQVEQESGIRLPLDRTMNDAQMAAIRRLASDDWEAVMPYVTGLRQGRTMDEITSRLTEERKTPMEQVTRFEEVRTRAAKAGLRIDWNERMTNDQIERLQRFAGPDAWQDIEAIVRGLQSGRELPTIVASLSDSGRTSRSRAIAKFESLRRRASTQHPGIKFDRTMTEEQVMQLRQLAGPDWDAVSPIVRGLRAGHAIDNIVASMPGSRSELDTRYVKFMEARKQFLEAGESFDINGRLTDEQVERLRNQVGPDTWQQIQPIVEGLQSGQSLETTMTLLAGPSNRAEGLYMKFHSMQERARTRGVDINIGHDTNAAQLQRLRVASGTSEADWAEVAPIIAGLRSGQTIDQILPTLSDASRDAGRSFAQLGSLMAQTQRWQKLATARRLDLRSRKEEDQRVARELATQAGVDSRLIDPLLKGLQEGKSISELLPSLARSTETARTDRPTAGRDKVEVAFKGPIRMEGTLQVRDDRHVHVDAASGTHRVPIETD